MPPVLQRFRAGQAITSLKAATLNALVDAANRVNNLRFGRGFTESRVGTEWIVNLRQEEQRKTRKVGVGTPPLTVLITAKPTLTDTRLKVRAVKYTGPDAAQTDGETDPYAFDGEAFDALPYFGFFVRDYDGLEHAAMEGETEPGPPDLRDHYLECKQQGDVWVVERPPPSDAGIAFGYVLALNTTGEHAGTLTVRFLKLTADGFVTDRDEYVLPWPKLFLQDYEQLRSPTNVISLQNIGGNWYAMQTLRWDLRPPAQTSRRVIC